MPTIAILDVDGTLVDTNYHHAIAWFRAFRRHDLTLQVWRIHRHIGMGGDQLVAALAGDEVEEELGDEIREAESESTEADRRCRRWRRRSDRDPRERATWWCWPARQGVGGRHSSRAARAKEIVDGWTTSADVEQTKPSRTWCKRRSTRSMAGRRTH
jgi:phosphoglycolate phosphatase-like HAD superfamily hydrolase